MYQDTARLMNNPIGKTKPKEITAVLKKLGIEFDDGYFSAEGEKAEDGVNFTAWSKGAVVAVLFRAHGTRKWKLVEEKDWGVNKAT